MPYSLSQRRCPTHGSCTPRGSRAPWSRDARACEASSGYLFFKRHHYVTCTGHLKAMWRQSSTLGSELHAKQHCHIHRPFLAIPKIKQSKLQRHRLKLRCSPDEPFKQDFGCAHALPFEKVYISVCTACYVRVRTIVQEDRRDYCRYLLEGQETGGIRQRAAYRTADRVHSREEEAPANGGLTLRACHRHCLSGSSCSWPTSCRARTSPAGGLIYASCTLLSQERRVSAVQRSGDMLTHPLTRSGAKLSSC